MSGTGAERFNASSSWRLKRSRYLLEAEDCQNCHEIIFPRRDICPHCNKEAGENLIHYSPVKPEEKSPDLNS